MSVIMLYNFYIIGFIYVFVFKGDVIHFLSILWNTYKMYLIVLHL